MTIVHHRNSTGLLALITTMETRLASASHEFFTSSSTASAGSLELFDPKRPKNLRRNSEVGHI